MKIQKGYKSNQIIYDMELIKKNNRYFYVPLRENVYVPSEEEYKDVLNIVEHGDMASELDLRLDHYNEVPESLKDRVKRVMITRGCAKKRVQYLAKEISKDLTSSGISEVTILGIAKGGLDLASDLKRAMDVNINKITDVLVTSSYESEEESTGSVKIYNGLTEKIKGKHVLIVEDIIDSGRTLNKIISEVIEPDNPESIMVVALCDKPSRRVEELPDFVKTYVGFKIPNEFIFGYGLDLDGKHRELKYVAVSK